MRRDIGLLHDPNRKPVKLNSLLSNFADQAGDFIGDSLGGIWSFMTNPSEERVAQTNIDEEAIKQKRLTPDEYGRTPQAWMYAERSDNPNKLIRFFENIDYNAGRFYREGSRMFKLPEETIEPVGNLIAGGVLNLSGGLLDESIGTEQRATANAFADTLKHTFSSWDNLTDAISNNPLDFMALALGGGYNAKKLADLANNPAVKESFRNTLKNMPDPADLLANNKMVSQFIPDPRQFLMMWHGSPRDFMALDNKFMLTGEGNNVKGAGFYMGGRASTSKQYFGEVDKQNDTYDTTNYDLFQEDVVDRMVQAKNDGNPLVEEMWKEVRDVDATPSEVSWLLDKYKDHPDLAKLKDGIRDYKQLWADQPFSLMKFDVSDNKVATFLNDSKAVYDQPDAVKKLLRQEHGAYMDLVDDYKPLQERRNYINKLMEYKDTAEPEALVKLQKELDEIDVKQQSIVNEINALGDFPHPDRGIDIYEFLVDRRAEQFPSSDMSTHNLKVSQYLHDNGVMGRRWADDLSTKYPDLYDSENFLIFDASTAKLLERNEVPVQPMIAQHNLREETLEKHLESTGIPMPSIAISRSENPNIRFGEISLLGTSEMVTPSSDTFVYPTDMYSGRAPDDRIVYKDPEGVLDMVDPDKLRFFANTKPLDNPDELFKGGGIAEMQGKTNREYINDQARRKLSFKDYDVGLLERQIATVDEAIQRGFDPYQYPTYREAIYEINNTLHDKGLPLLKSYHHIEREGLLGETVRTMVNPKGNRTPTGRERPDITYSAEEAFKIMKKKGAYKTGAEDYPSFNQTYALSTSPFKDLQEIKDNRGLLEDERGISSGDAEDLFGEDLDTVRDKISKFSDRDTSYLIDDVLRNGRLSVDDIELHDLTAKEAKEIEKTILSLKEKNRPLLGEEWAKANPELAEATTSSGLLATEYFEAKPKRIIDIAEFKGAIIPEDTKPRIIELLKQKGIKKILTYGSEGQRKELFKKFPELQFIGLAMPMGLLSNEEEQRKGLLL